MPCAPPDPPTWPWPSARKASFCTGRKLPVNGAWVCKGGGAPRGALPGHGAAGKAGEALRGSSWGWGQRRTAGTVRPLPPKCSGKAGGRRQGRQAGRASRQAAARRTMLSGKAAAAESEKVVWYRFWPRLRYARRGGEAQYRGSHRGGSAAFVCVAVNRVCRMCAAHRPLAPAQPVRLEDDGGVGGGGAGGVGEGRHAQRDLQASQRKQGRPVGGCPQHSNVGCERGRERQRSRCGQLAQGSAAVPLAARACMHLSPLAFRAPTRRWETSSVTARSCTSKASCGGGGAAARVRAKAGAKAAGAGGSTLRRLWPLLRAAQPQGRRLPAPPARLAGCPRQSG